MGLSDIRSPLFQIRYKFSNYLDENLHGEPEDFVNSIIVEVIEEDEHEAILASCELGIILFQLAIAYDYPVYYVIDASESISQMSEELIKLEEGKVIQAIGGYDEIDLEGKFNVLLFDEIEVRSEWKGLEIERKIIKNVTERFYSSFGVIVIQNYLSSEIAIQDEDSNLFDMGFKRHTKDFFIATPKEILRKMSGDFPS